MAVSQTSILVVVAVAAVEAVVEIVVVVVGVYFADVNLVVWFEGVGLEV